MWYATKAGNGADQHIVIDEDSSATVAVTYSDVDGKNAALIAAAPKMFEALEAIDELFTGNVSNALHARMRRIAMDAIEAARA